jgi:two-component system, cell cycle sensor histidine kinase and response regulator CckA
MLRRLIGENIDLTHSGASDLSMVMADPGQMEQVLMNLAVNARDAMPRGGKLHIETKNAVLDDELARLHKYVNPGEYVLLSVTDNGCGMDEEIQSQIFEPFFTTKEVGKGTGLGLSTVYGIVKQSGGYIWVDSAPGKGTRFRIYLPASSNVVDGTSATQRATSIPLGSETVLLVEDEAALRELACSALCAGGYTVLEAGSAESAMALVKQHGGRIHLLLTDVILPGLSGRDLAASLSRDYPELKTIFMSGYTDDLLGEHGMLGPEITLIEKPFSNRTLLATMRAVLDK